MKSKFALLSIVLTCVLAVHASKDNPCHSGDFQLIATPEKSTFGKGEAITIQLSLKNATSRDVFVIPEMFPFDYWVEKHSNGRWLSLATGIVAPNAGQRANNSKPTYLRIHAGETFTRHFQVNLSKITRRDSGTFRLASIRVHIYENDLGPTGSECALFTSSKSSSFTVR